MKKIMILGGGINQMPLINAANDEGYYTILCDYNKDAVGRKKCDKFYEVSILEENQIIKIAKNENIDGIVANTESVMDKLAYITEQLGLVGNKEKTIKSLVSKSEFRKLQYDANLFAPKYIESECLSNIMENIDDLNFPIIIKPSKSSGSRGATLIEIKNYDKIESAFNLCREYSRNNLVVAEEYIERVSMDECEADFFVFDGEILWDGLLLTTRNPKNPLIPMNDIYPLPYSHERISIIKNELTKAIKAADITHGEYNAELYFTENENLFIIEINARQGGESIPKYVKMSTGVDLCRLLVTTAVNDRSYWEQIKDSERNISYVTHAPIFSYENGRYRDVKISDEIKPYIIEKVIEVKKGDIVHAATDASDRIGYVDFKFPSQEIQLDISLNLDSLISVITDNDKL